jgi:hypothetical protein
MRREINEGDIFILGDINIKYLVEYRNASLMGKQIGSSSFVGLSFWSDRIEIIGNIYKNPELLNTLKP